jgi:hypothetical protein
MTPPCPTCARLRAEAEYLARFDWWAAWAKWEELARHEGECEVYTDYFNVAVVELK